MPTESIRPREFLPRYRRDIALPHKAPPSSIETTTYILAHESFRGDDSMLVARLRWDALRRLPCVDSFTCIIVHLLTKQVNVSAVFLTVAWIASPFLSSADQTTRPTPRFRLSSYPPPGLLPWNAWPRRPLLHFPLPLRDLSSIRSYSALRCCCYCRSRPRHRVASRSGRDPPPPPCPLFVPSR